MCVCVCVCITVYINDYYDFIYGGAPWCNGYRRRKCTRVQILDETDFISHSTNTLEKAMNPIILPPVMGK